MLTTLNTVYHNTTNETGETLRRYEAITGEQDSKILTFFRRCPDQGFTPFDVLHSCDWQVTPPITSVRRAITNLEHAGLLVKLDEKRPGAYGRDNHVWKYKKVCVQLSII